MGSPGPSPNPARFNTWQTPPSSLSLTRSLSLFLSSRPNLLPLSAVHRRHRCRLPPANIDRRSPPPSMLVSPSLNFPINSREKALILRNSTIWGKTGGTRRSHLLRRRLLLRRRTVLLSTRLVGRVSSLLLSQPGAAAPTTRHLLPPSASCRRAVRLSPPLLLPSLSDFSSTPASFLFDDEGVGHGSFSSARFLRPGAVGLRRSISRRRCALPWHSLPAALHLCSAVARSFHHLTALALVARARCHPPPPLAFSLFCLSAPAVMSSPAFLLLVPLPSDLSFLPRSAGGPGDFWSCSSLNRGHRRP